MPAAWANSKLTTTLRSRVRFEAACGLGHRNIALSPESGMVILDIVHGAIMFVEVLDRPGVKVPIPAC